MLAPTSAGVGQSWPDSFSEMFFISLQSNGVVVAWGDNSFGQTSVPAGLSNVVAIAAGDFHTLALRADGTVVGWGDDSYGQTDVPGYLNQATAVASGYYHGLALEPPMLQMQRAAGGLVLRWDGPATLQQSAAPYGPFSDVSTTGRSYTNSDMSWPVKYFRLRR